MRAEFAFAWSKLYMAVMELATSQAPLPDRVAQVFRRHLGSLNSQNLPAEGFERLSFIRAKLSKLPDPVEDDATLDIAPMTLAEAVAVAEEIVSLYDEIAKANARENIPAADEVRHRV
jgi:hypothetical protein